MKVPGFSKRSGHATIAARTVVLITLLQGIGFAQTGTATLCKLSNGLATGFFGGVSVSGSFTVGVTPADRSIITVQGAPNSVYTINYTFTGPLDGPGYTQTSKLPIACVLGPPCPPNGNAGIQIASVNPTTASIFFSDTGEDFAGTGTLACSTFPYTPPANGGVCPVNVSPFTGGPTSADNQPESMNANYTPAVNGFAIGLDAAAALCQVDSFNFVQQVTADPYLVFDYQAVAQTPPHSDPVAGGYCATFPACFAGSPNSNAYPFYFDQLNLTGGGKDSCDEATAAPIKTANTLLFQDCPGDPRRQPGDDPVAFTASLVGVLGTCSTTATSTVGCTISSTLYSWLWTSTYNNGDANTGGVHLTGYTPLASGGTGGVTITNINGVQLPPAVPAGQISTTASGLAYSRVSRTFTGTVTITNIGGALIRGPIQVVLFGLPATVTLVNATNNLSGTPYVTVAAPVGIAPGQSVTIQVQFSNPSNTTISFTPGFYTGLFQ